MTKARAIVGLGCDKNAIEGIRLLLHTRLEEMCGLRASALDWSDIEGVHDMRVASRRLRSALRDFKPNLKRRKLRDVSNAIKRIADSLGVVRDNDVAIAALEKLAATAPPDVAVGIELFTAERRARREDDRIALMDAVTDDQLANLQLDFDAALESSLASTNHGKSKVAEDQHEVSFRAVGQLIIKARMEELQTLGKCLYHPFATKPLHRMRIAAKRLRYAVELFAQCWDTELDSCARDIAEMQTSLGELHDCDVWIAEFGELLEQQSVARVAIEPTGTADVDKAQCHATVWLLGHFTKRRTNHYRDALARWHDWETTDFFGSLETCVRSIQANRGSSHAVLSIVDTIEPDVDSSRAS